MAWFKLQCESPVKILFEYVFCLKKGCLFKITDYLCTPQIDGGFILLNIDLFKIFHFELIATSERWFDVCEDIQRHTVFNSTLQHGYFGSC